MKTVLGRMLRSLMADLVPVAVLISITAFGVRASTSDRHPGDALDFWRVETVEAPALLRLRAEMKVPGRAWLQFEVRATQGSTLLAQTAIFAPKGLAGLLYWYALYPVHALIFSGLVRRLAARAEAS